MSREYDQIKSLIRSAEECLSTAYRRGYKDGKNSVDPKTKMANFIEIPEGATLGDMVMLIAKDEPMIDVFGNPYMCFTKSQWNSPYRKDR